MLLFERARLYGQAVQVLDEFLGEAVRERVMERFAHIAGPRQQRGMKDPWEMIAQSAVEAGVDPESVKALHLVYLMRTNRMEALPDWVTQQNDIVWELLRDWRILSEFEAKRKRFER